MEIIFSTATGQRIQWDGLLWRSVDLPLVARKLNSEVFPEPSQHSSILQWATMQLVEKTGPVTFEIYDNTGWPAKELGDIEFPDSGLAGIEILGETANHDSTTPGRITQGTLAEARAFLKGCVCADGAADGDADWDRQEREWTALTKWSAEKGLILATSGPERTGGREPDVTYDPHAGRWIKFTKQNSAGFTVDWAENGTPFIRNALPSEYLDRVHFQNNLLEDRVELLGIWRAGKHSWSIVTSQPDVVGQKVSLDELRLGMEEMGFVRLKWKGIGYKHSEAWRLGRMLLWDVHPANVVRFGSVTIPIDVIITPLPYGYAPEHFHELETSA